MYPSTELQIPIYAIPAHPCQPTAPQSSRHASTNAHGASKIAAVMNMKKFIVTVSYFPTTGWAITAYAAYPTTLTNVIRSPFSAPVPNPSSPLSLASTAAPTTQIPTPIAFTVEIFSSPAHLAINNTVTGASDKIIAECDTVVYARPNVNPPWLITTPKNPSPANVFRSSLRKFPRSLARASRRPGAKK